MKDIIRFLMDRDGEDRKKISIKTIEWLRNCINKIG